DVDQVVAGDQGQVAALDQTAAAHVARFGLPARKRWPLWASTASLIKSGLVSIRYLCDRNLSTVLICG
ncbi:hypothetical protein, partial [Pseudomonas sp. AL03]|uniref:hypothetical protein n=1 Tax=Pseudomonas sp. AL03 TaxID=3042230 RepID=UPI00249C535F